MKVWKKRARNPLKGCWRLIKKGKKGRGFKTKKDEKLVRSTQGQTQIGKNRKGRISNK